LLLEAANPVHKLEATVTSQTNRRGPSSRSPFLWTFE